MLTVAHAYAALEGISEETYTLINGFETSPEARIQLTVTTETAGSGYMSYEVGVLEVELREEEQATGFSIFFSTTASSNTFLQRLLSL